MRDYGRIHTAFWTSPDIQPLSDDGKLLAAYLLTSPHATIVGVCYLPDGYITEDLGDKAWPAKRVRQGFAELSRNGFCNRCETTKWVWIRKFMLWNRPENPNQWKAAARVADQIPARCSFLPEFSEVFAALRDGKPFPELEPLSNGSETLSKPGTGTGTGTGAGILRPSDAVEQGSTDRPPDPVVLVFTHWQTVHNHPKAQLDAKRRKLIRAALQHYTPEDLCRSISGYLNSPHHMGTDPRGNGTKYDSIELLLRDAAHIDRGLQFHDEPPTAPIAISRGRQTRFDELMGGLDEADREIAHEAH